MNDSFTDSMLNKALTITQGFGTIAVVQLADIEMGLKLALLFASVVYTVTQIKLALNKIHRQRIAEELRKKCPTSECPANEITPED